MRVRARLLAPGVVLAILAGCVPKAPPPPAPRPARVPLPTPAQPPRVTSTDWRDWPLTPGTWRYAASGNGSTATFGNAGASLFTLSCGTDRRVRLQRPIAAAGAMTIRTTSTARSVPTAPFGDPPAGAGATLAATDSLLDAMGYSRGKFVVEGAGAPTLVLPAWAEVLRVVEDCRG